MSKGGGLVRAYASRTGTGDNLAALRAAGWGLMISARGVHRDEGFTDLVLDNGAWTSHTKGEPFNVDAFKKVVEIFGDRSRWVVLPDIVEGGLASLAFSLSWLEWCLARCPSVMLAAQDGMTPLDLAPHIGGRVGVFIGGSDDFKIGPPLDDFAAAAHEAGTELHVGRVNSVRRINRCRDVRAHSFDGSGPSRFNKHLAVLERGRAQGHLWGGY